MERLESLSLAAGELQSLSKIGLTRYLDWVFTYKTVVSGGAAQYFGAWIDSQLWPELNKWCAFMEQSPDKVGEARQAVNRALFHLDDFAHEQVAPEDVGAAVYSALAVLRSSLEKLVAYAKVNEAYRQAAVALDQSVQSLAFEQFQVVLSADMLLQYSLNFNQEGSYAKTKTSKACYAAA